MFINAIEKLSKLCGFIAVFLTGSALIVVCQMVIWRYFLDKSTIWQTEYITFAIIGTTFIGSPYVALHKGHVNIDLLPLHLGHRGRLLLAYFASLGSMLFALIFAWLGAKLWMEAWDGNWKTDTIWALPLWIPYLAMPLGMATLVLQYAADILSLMYGRQMPFGLSPEQRP